MCGGGKIKIPDSIQTNQPTHNEMKWLVGTVRYRICIEPRNTGRHHVGGKRNDKYSTTLIIYHSQEQVPAEKKGRRILQVRSRFLFKLVTATVLGLPFYPSAKGVFCGKGQQLSY